MTFVLRSCLAGRRQCIRPVGWRQGAHAAASPARCKHIRVHRRSANGELGRVDGTLSAGCPGAGLSAWLGAPWLPSASLLTATSPPWPSSGLWRDFHNPLWHHKHLLLCGHALRARLRVPLRPPCDVHLAAHCHPVGGAGAAAWQPSVHGVPIACHPPVLVYQARSLMPVMGLLPSCS